jgi:hypothetical protein
MLGVSARAKACARGRQRPADVTLWSCYNSKMQLDINVERLLLNRGSLTAPASTLTLQRTSGAKVSEFHHLRSDRAGSSAPFSWSRTTIGRRRTRHADRGLRRTGRQHLMLRETGLPEKGMRIRSRINKLHLLRLVDKIFIAGFLDSGKPIPSLWVNLRVRVIVDQTHSARG